jgi:Arc/MetJ-type ribon-helix-helix transcriptional regulator
LQFQSLRFTVPSSEFKPSLRAYPVPSLKFKARSSKFFFWANIRLAGLVRLDREAIKWQDRDMATKLKTVHVTLTPQIATLLESEVAAGRFANISEALRNAAWKAFAEDPAAELKAVFAQMDATGEKDAPDEDIICAEVRAHRKGR